MDERIIDVDGNEIIISVDGVDDIEIADISFEDAEELEGDLISQCGIRGSLSSRDCY